MVTGWTEPPPPRVYPLQTRSIPPLDPIREYIYRSNERMTMRNLQISESAESRHVSICSSHPTSQIKTDLPQPAQISCWLLRFLQKHEITKYCRGVGSSEWLGQLRESGRRHPSSTASHQQSHQPQAESTDPKTSANLGVTSTLSRSSTVRIPDLRTS